MTARFAAHNPPDVFYVDSSVVGSWEKQHVLQPLNSFVAKTHFNTKKFYPKLLNAFKHGKTIYGFPKDWGPLAEETSNALLGQAGVKAPKTWAQLKSVATDDSVEGRRQASDLPLARLGADGRLHVPEQGLDHEAPHVDGQRQGGQATTSA